MESVAFTKRTAEFQLRQVKDNKKALANSIKIPF